MRRMHLQQHARRRQSQWCAEHTANAFCDQRTASGATLCAALCAALRNAPSGPCLPEAEVAAAGGVCAAAAAGAVAVAAAVAAHSATAAAHPEAAGSDLRAQCSAP